MPRDWPDPRWPADRPIRWWHLILPTAATLAGAASLLATLWPG